MKRIKKLLMRGILPMGVMAAGCGMAAAYDDVLKAPLERNSCMVGEHQFMLLQPNVADLVIVTTDSLPGPEEPGVLLRVAAVNNPAMGFAVQELRRGYDDVTCTGHLLAVGTRVSIRPNSDLDASVATAVKENGYLFQQCLIVEDGAGRVERIPQAIRDREAHIIYRAACIMNDGSFAVIQGIDKMYCHEFIDGLVKLGVQQALYLDMGTWAYGWYREHNGDPIVELAPHFDNTRYQSNWLVVRSCY